MSFIFFVYYIFYNLDQNYIKKKGSKLLIYEFATLTNRLLQIHLINTKYTVNCNRSKILLTRIK